MLRHYRRYWIVIVAALMATPLAMSPRAPTSDAIAQEEFRDIAPAPGFPQDRDDWLRLPAAVDLYLADHFGLRSALIQANAVVTQLLLHTGNSSVLIGRNGWLFNRQDDMIEQSAGLLLREARLQETADTLASVKVALAKRGIKFLVALPPNSATIYPDHLPAWARNHGRPTEYDLMLAALAARHVRAIDLRPPLVAAKARDRVYLQHDTHWNFRGAVIAFNTVIDAAGHQDWHLDPTAVLSTTMAVGGDLARMLGINDDVTEQVPKLLLTGGRTENFSPEPMATFLSTSDQSSGPTVLVIGDSFAHDYFQLALAHTP